MTGLFERLQSRSPIAWLRKHYPEENWRAIRFGWGSWGYEGNNDAMAHWCACLAPKYDGDDESFESRFYIYRKNKPPEWVLLI